MKILNRLLILSMAFATVATSLPAENLGTLFPNRAAISVDGSGLSRLELPAEVIGPCRSDLADLRILSESGREVPFLVDSPDAVGTAVELRHRATPKVVSAKRSRKALDSRVTRYREDYVLGVPPVPDDVAAWDLVVTVERPEFVSRVTILSIDGQGQTTTLLQDGSFFRLPDAGAEKRRFTIPDRRISRLELTLEGLDQGYLDPRFTLEARRILPVSEKNGAALKIIETLQNPRSTELVVVRPRGLVPRRLLLNTTTGTFHRKITVWDEGPGADPDTLGSNIILRIDAIAPIEDLEIPLRPARGDRLRVVIDNQDSPPLESPGISALVPQPVLIFSLPEGETRATLVFGGGRAHRPRYDLFALEGRGDLPATGDSAGRALALLDPARASTATLGPVESNPLYDATPALEFAMHPGASIDPRLYSHRRRIEVQPSQEGLARIKIDTSDLAVMRPDMADLRIIDSETRQWAYLRQDRSRIVDIELRQMGHRVEDRRSHYPLEIPDPPMTVGRLRIQTEAPFFDRDFRLQATLEDGKKRDLVQGRFFRRLGDPRPVRFDFSRTRVIGLELILNDGDDAPLALISVSARIPAPNLYLAAEPGAYEVLMGFPEAQPPHYELEKIRSTV
ncbi:MAG: hypothetical protein ABFS37_07355, partial [Acidobacteriota bacterium]